ncbi:MAG: endonuclease/exonuclease/phosphatase family protein [Devosia sp.]
MHQVLLGFVQIIAGLLILAVSIPAILALFGFAVPVFDLFNHLQLLLFFGTLAGVILGLIVFGIRPAMTWIAVLGFAASSFTFVPEWTSSLAARAPFLHDGPPVLKLMTHNLFGLNYDMPRVAAVIAAENPDIIALQEYFPEQVEGLDQLLKPNYPFSVRCTGGKRANLGLYSKIPFDKEMASGECPTSAVSGRRTARIIAGFVLEDGTRFSVMTTHMDWPLPIARQQEEFAEAKAEVKAIGGPLLLVGDFNSTPWSYALKAFAADTGLTRETRNLLTYPERFTLRGLVRTVSFLPLDQVFERGIDVHELHRGEETGSDHLPVIFSFSVPKS